MKKHRTLWAGASVAIMLMLAMSFVTAADTPPIVGQWGGTLDPGAQPKKRVLVHISQAQDGTLSGAIDYPDQDTSGIPITAITYKEPALHFESSSGLAAFDGTMNKDNSAITGTWKQAGASLSLTLKKTP